MPFAARVFAMTVPDRGCGFILHWGSFGAWAPTALGASRQFVTVGADGIYDINAFGAQGGAYGTSGAGGLGAEIEPAETRG